MFDFAYDADSGRQPAFQVNTRQDHDDVLVEIIRTARVLPGDPVETIGIRIYINDEYADLSLDEATLMLRLTQEAIEAVKDTPPADNPFENKERWND